MPQALAELAYKKVEVDWICDDSSWAITVEPSGGYEEIDGGSSLNFTVAVTVPSDATANTTCAANVQADEVRSDKSSCFRQASTFRMDKPSIRKKLRPRIIFHLPSDNTKCMLKRPEHIFFILFVKATCRVNEFML